MFVALSVALLVGNADGARRVNLQQRMTENLAAYYRQRRTIGDEAQLPSTEQMLGRSYHCCKKPGVIRSSWRVW